MRSLSSLNNHLCVFGAIMRWRSVSWQSVVCIVCLGGTVKAPWNKSERNSRASAARNPPYQFNQLPTELHSLSSDNVSLTTNLHYPNIRQYCDKSYLWNKLIFVTRLFCSKTVSSHTYYYIKFISSKLLFIFCIIYKNTF